jgi:hypothetical protein
MSCGPADEVGTVNVAVNVPEADVIIEFGVVARFVMSNVSVIVEEGANPVPVMVTVDPTVPVEGFKLIEGAISEKVVDAESDVSAADTVWAPSAAVGIMNVAENVPVLVDVIDEGVVAMVKVSNFIVIGEFGR